jgi:hypothetical protein
MRDAGMQVLLLIAQPGEPLNPIFENLTGKRVDALLIQGSIARKEMPDLAIQHCDPSEWARRGSRLRSRNLSLTGAIDQSAGQAQNRSGNYKSAAASGAGQCGLVHHQPR